MDIVIEYDPGSKEYKIYEPTSDTLLHSLDLTEGLVNLDAFLRTQGLIPKESSILSENEIEYHLDSYTMRAIIQSNVGLLKRLKNTPSEFRNSSSRFGMSGSSGGGDSGATGQGGWGSGSFTRCSKNFSQSKFGGQKNSGFGQATKKWKS